MWHGIKGLFAWLLVASAANAGAILELVPTPSGPYQPGQLINVDVLVHIDEHSPVLARTIRLDFSTTDVRLALDAAFVFDHSSVPPGTLWGIFDFPDIPRPATTFFFDIAGPLAAARLYPGQANRIGGIGLTLPLQRGTYLLDAMNRADPDFNHGALMDMAFWPPEFPWVGMQYWRAYTGELSGGDVNLVVVPEPPSLTILLLFALLGRARGHRVMWPSLRKRLS